MTAAGAVILDGKGLARQRETDIARRATAISQARGRPPTLLLVAFADADGSVPHVTGKVRACQRVRVHAEPLVLRSDVDATEAVHLLELSVNDTAPDAVFLQVPFPQGVAEDVLLRMVPPELDVDTMTPHCAGAYLRGEHDLSPVTVTGALQLLDASGIDVRGRSGVLAAEDTVYSALIMEAFRRRNVELERVAPTAADLEVRIADAELIIAAAGHPGLITTSMLQRGCVALDFGYYNPAARGDIDTRAGTGHLAALMPVPGGVGPMTVSALVERVVLFAER